MLVDTLRLQENDLLFIHGNRVRSAFFTWNEGGPLFMNGVRVSQAEWRTRVRSTPMESYRKFHKDTPFILARVDSGDSWNAAVLEWDSKVESLETCFRGTYQDALKSSGNPVLAQNAVIEAVREMTSPLVTRPPECFWNKGFLNMQWAGMKGPSMYSEERLASPGQKPFEGPVQARDARMSVDTVKAWFGTRRPVLYVLPEKKAPKIIRKDVEAALAQIRNSTPDSLASGPLPLEHLLEIVKCGGLDQ